MGLAEREYMKRTPEELDSGYRSSRRSGLDSHAMVWIVGLAVAAIAIPQLFSWLGICFLPLP